MKTLIVEFRAGREVEEIVEYYEAKEHGLGVAFQSHLKSAFLSIRRSPEAFGHDSVTGTRTYRLKRFPHIVHYLIEEHEIVVMAVAHPKRKPGYWRR